MLKFLRKYNKIILVIGGALLMVAFLMPQAIQQLGQDQSGREYMRIEGEKVTMAEADKAERRRYVIRQVAPMILPTLGIEDRTEHWILLTHEARQHGLIGGPQDGRDFTADLADFVGYSILQQQFGQFAQQLLNSPNGQQFFDQAKATAREMIDQVRERSAIGTEEFDLALAELHGVARLRKLYDGGPGRLSDRRAILDGLRMHNAATVDYVFIPADTAVEQIPEPDDQALAAHLERYRDVRPGEGDYGVGYLLPPRVKLEWLTLDREAIAAAVRVGRVEVAERFMRENPGAPASGPEFEAIRGQLEEQLRKEATDRIMAEADQAIRAEFAKVTRRLDTQGAYRVLPPNWAEIRPDLQNVRDAVVERIKSAAGRTIAAPAVTTMDSKWLTANELQSLPKIGTSSIRRGSRSIPFANAALSVKELGDPLDMGLQVGVPGGVTTDAAGNQYYFTVLDARPESPPASVDEIRETLVNDYRRIEAFKLLERDADVYRQRAVNEGLDSLTTLADPSPVIDGMPAATPPGATPQIRRAVTVTRVSNLAQLPQADQEAVKDAIVKSAETLDPTAEAAAVDAAERTVVVPAPKALGLVVAQVQSFRPLTTERYRQMDAGLVQQAELDASQTSEADPFDIERVAERLNAKLPVRQNSGAES